jgi:NAD+ synthase (glutamine-hydrolysing)
MRIGLAQINSTVGDIEGNTKKIIEYINTARKQKVDLIVFPELAICGYPPKDLLLKKDFLAELDRNLKRIIKNSNGIGVIVGTVECVNKKVRPLDIYDVSMTAHFPGYMLHNSAMFISNGRLIGSQAKTYLPNYDIFDEQRYFVPAAESKTFNAQKGRGAEQEKIGITICEDIWVDDKPIKRLKDKGATLIINISSSPFYVGKYKIRKALVRQRTMSNKIPIFYCNLVGGQDDLVFDGGSFGFDTKGRLITEGRRFEEDFIVIDTEKEKYYQRDTESTQEELEADIYSALVSGLKDYTNKNGFNKVILGLSGGVDSALVACLAVAALGRQRVELVMMPGPFSTESSIKDALAISQNLGIEPSLIPITETYESYLRTLRTEFKGMGFNSTEENIQARIRGNILMALSNKFGYLVLTTGNKSELSVGYSTLYGDMAGGLAVISDLPKNLVYRLCGYINQNGIEQEFNIVPKSILVKAPSAELRANQTDQDDLPPYDVLDRIIHLYIEENKGKEEIIRKGFSRKIVSDIIRRIDHNEYKRQQAPLGIKITPKAFGFGRRMPITNAFK